MRLTRTGSRKRPSYRVIVADSRAPRDGRHVDILGLYDPMTTPSTVRIDVPRAVQWLRNGAQPTERVRILLRHAGVLKAHEEARLADKRARKEAAASQPERPPRPPKPAATEKSAAKSATKTVAKAAPRVSRAAKSAAAKTTAKTAAKKTATKTARAKTATPAAKAAKTASKSARSRAASKTKS